MDPREAGALDRTTESQRWLFTFGPNHLHPITGESLGTNYVIIPGSYESTRREINAVCGPHWSFQYDAESEWMDKIASYGLVEIPWSSFTQREEV